MLKLLRHKRVAKIVLWGILILILPAFVIWGTGNLSKSKEKGPAFVGLINNKKVTFDDFANSLTCMRAQILLNFFSQPQILDAFLKNNEFMGKMAWDRLIMLREAEKMKYKVSNTEVVTFVRGLAIFNRGGGFDDRIYNYVLRNNIGLTPRAFEEMMRENLMIQKMQADLTKDVKASDNDILEQYKSNSEKFKVLYALLPVDAEKKYKEVIDLMANKAIAFEEAAEKSGLKIEKTEFFSKADYLDGIGEASQLTGAAAQLKAGEVSSPVQTRKGVLVFKLVETQNYNEENFKKEKPEYSKKVLEEKKNKFMEGWLKDLESKNKLNIDLKEYDKYYQ